MTYFEFSMVLVGVTFLRFGLITSLTYFYFWGWKNPITEKRRIQKIDFTQADIFRDIKYSLSTYVVMGLILAYGYNGYLQAGTFLPTLEQVNIKTLGWAVLLVAVHDTYFYWMHRLFHYPKLFRHFHRIHHLSKNPSPFTGVALHPLEAVLEVIWVLPFALYLPIPILAWQIFAFTMAAVAVLGHSNIELIPKSWQLNPILKYVATFTAHNDHHKYVNCNYGFYFSFWDRTMGTLLEPKSRKDANSYEETQKKAS